jgi:hypothetical protein
MFAASGGRVGLGLLFAPFVLVALPSDEAARMFQLLFLQGGLIALLSASAYARGAQLAASGAAIWRSMRKFLAYLVLAAPVALAGGALLVPIPAQTQLMKCWILSVLVAGAAGAALNGFLQGVTVVRRGGTAAFLPALGITMAACAIVISLWRPQGALTVALVWGVPQLLSPAALLLTVPDVRRFVRRGPGAALADSSYFAATGLANASSIGIAYAFRERWAAARPSEQAATGFLVVRVSELLYQVVYMGAASLPRTLNRLFGDRLRSTRAQVTLLVAGLALAAPAFLPVAIWEHWALSQFLAAELLIAPARLLTILCLLTLLARRTTRAYQIAVITGVVISAALMTVPRVQSSAFGLQAFQAANAIATVLVTTCACRADATRRRRLEGDRDHAPDQDML